MPSARFTLRFSDDESAQIASLSQAAGLSQVDLVRIFVRRGLAGHDEALSRMESRLTSVEAALASVVTMASSTLGYLAFHQIPLVTGDLVETRTKIKENINIGLSAGRHVRNGLENGSFEKG